MVENAVEWSQKGHWRCEEVTEAACGSSSAPGTALQDSPVTKNCGNASFVLVGWAELDTQRFILKLF